MKLNPLWAGMLAASLCASQAFAAGDSSSQTNATPRNGGLTVFRPTVEKVLKSEEASRDQSISELLDLDTGGWATNPVFGNNDRETHAWIRSNRVDVLGVVEHGQIAVLCMDVAVVPAASNGWDKVTAQNVTTNWSLAQTEPNKITAISPITDKTDTWLFRTREGGQGILQILGRNNQPPGVRIRYRLVRTSR
jgi:hypothetical protein